jgi:hypothetical protein
MNPGLPGTGIGGLFYILVALCMPVCEVVRRLQGDATRGPLVAKQFAIALGVVAAMTSVFWGLDALVMLDRVAAHAAASAHHAGWSLRVSALMVTSGVLATVLSSVEFVRLCLRLSAVRHAAR